MSSYINKLRTSVTKIETPSAPFYCLIIFQNSELLAIINNNCRNYDVSQNSNTYTYCSYSNYISKPQFYYKIWNHTVKTTSLPYA